MRANLYRYDSSRNSNRRSQHTDLFGIAEPSGRDYPDGYHPCVPLLRRLMDDTPDMYAHYFISSQIYFEHTSFFLPRKPKTIVLAGGDNQPQLSGVPTLNIYQDEKGLVKDILQLHRYGHQHGHPDKQPDSLRSAMPPHAAGNADAHELSAREIEVLVLITKGLINKEIADKLNISLTTVITHRKNIVEKLGIKSVSGLTIYAVMHGYIDADRI